MTYKFKELACGHHSHAEFSLDACSSAYSKILHAASIGRVGDVLTDHGIMSGLLPHWEANLKLKKEKKIPNDFKSIHGIEAYVVDEDRPFKQLKNGKLEPQYYHLTIHFKTLEAYKYFCRLTPIMGGRGIIKVGELKPLLYFHELEPIAGQICLSSSCMMGPVQKNILLGRTDIAKMRYEYLRSLAGPGNWKVEVFPHTVTHDYQRPIRDKDNKKLIIEPGKWIPAVQKRDPDAIDEPFAPDPCTGLIDLQKPLNEYVIAMAKHYGDPVVVSLDDHFAKPEDKAIQDVKLSNGMDAWIFHNTYASYDSGHCYKMFNAQMGIQPKIMEEWIDNSYEFVELFNDYKMETAEDRWLLPTTEMVYNVKTSSLDKLNEIITKVGRLPKEDHPDYKSRKDRLDYEVSVLRDNGVADFLPYFFVVEDVANYCRKAGILFNTRGSASGSYVLYLLGISITDPFRYNLPFERFLTLGRIKSGSLPDIDFDIQDRDPVIAYLKEKYGDRCSLIATNMLMRLKTSILDVERAKYGYVNKNTSYMCAMFKGSAQGQSDLEWLNGSVKKETGEVIPGFLQDEKDPIAQMLREYIEYNPEIWSTVLKCIGINKSRGVHPGGVILAPEPIQNYMPMIMTNMGVATAYDMKGVERVGGVKFDFLGVSTLKSLGITMKSIKDVEGIDLEWDEFPHDESVYTDIIQKDKLSAIFQLNTKLVRPYVNALKPKNIQQLANITALIRPGALESPAPNPNYTGHAASYYKDVISGNEKPYYIHDDVKHIFEPTMGVCIFQEQTLQTFRDIAGYTYEDAEGVRRAVGKKDKKLMELHIGILKNKCLERKWRVDQADRLAEMLIKSAGYSFNLSHSINYSIVAYNGCWLKKHYPLHFWKGELTVNSDDHDKLRSYFSEFKQYLLPMSIVHSHPTDWLIEKDGLRPPLSLIKGCGDKGVLALNHFIKTPLADLVSTMTEEEINKPIKIKPTKDIKIKGIKIKDIKIPVDTTPIARDSEW